MAATDVIDSYVEALPYGGRRLASGEWGVTVSPEAAAGWPLEGGMRLHEGLFTVQAFALAADDSINPWNFLHWKPGTRMARFAGPRSGDIWVHADLPAGAIDERTLDRLLGLVVEGAVAARRAVSEHPAPAGGSGWDAAR